MRFFTKKQKTWFFTKTIKVGSFYMFPRFGFTVYSEPRYSSGEHMDTNPFTKSLDTQYFNVKEITDNGFVKGNFLDKPHYKDFYLTLTELSSRSLFEVLFLFLI